MTRGKLEWLRSARLIHGDQKITTRHAKVLNKTKELISLLASKLSAIKPISQLASKFSAIKQVDNSTFRCGEQASLISESVIEIRINCQHCKGNNLTTWHTWATEATRVATFHVMVKESIRVLPHASVVFHAYALMDTPWVTRRYPIWHP
jgi:hypothetical protein